MSTDILRDVGDLRSPSWKPRVVSALRFNGLAPRSRRGTRRNRGGTIRFRDDVGFT